MIVPETRIFSAGKELGYTLILLGLKMTSNKRGERKWMEDMSLLEREERE